MRRIAAVGTPLCLTELDSGVLAALEAEAAESAERIRIRITDQVEFEG